MTTTAAHVILGDPSLPEPLNMRIVVPGTEDAKRRIATYARVIARVYSKQHGFDSCSWCGEALVKSRIFHSTEEGMNVYCSSPCLVASL